MRLSGIALLLSSLLVAAGANEPVELKALPKDSLSDQMDPDLRASMEAAHRKYNSRDEKDRLAAVQLFAAILDPMADADLVKISEADGHPLVRLKATEALITRENRKGAVLAARLSVSAVPLSIRKQAADLVRKTWNEEAEFFLLEVLKYGSLKSNVPLGFGIDRPYNNLEDILYQTMAATALGRVGSPPAVKALIEGLSHKHWELRAACAKALGDTGQDDAIAPLARKLRDEDMDVAIESALALGRLGGTEAIAALKTAAKDKRPLVVRMAERARRHAEAMAAAPKPGQPGAGAKPAAGGGTTAQPERPPERIIPPPEIVAPEGSADMLFLVDSTFSMRAEWPSVRAQVQGEVLRRPDDGGDVRFGVILFRDFDNRYLTRQLFLTWDYLKFSEWFFDDEQMPAGANAFAGSACDKALAVALMFNLRADHAPWLVVMSDVPANSPPLADHRSRMLHEYDRATVDAVYVDRDTETRGQMSSIAQAGGGRVRAYRSGGNPAPK